MTHPPQNTAEIERSIEYARIALRLDQAEIRQHVDRLNWLYKRRNDLTRQIARDRKRIAEAQRSAVAES